MELLEAVQRTLAPSPESVPSLPEHGGPYDEERAAQLRFGACGAGSGSGRASGGLGDTKLWQAVLGLLAAGQLVAARLGSAGTLTFEAGLYYLLDSRAAALAPLDVILGAFTYVHAQHTHADAPLAGVTDERIRAAQASEEQRRLAQQLPCELVQRLRSLPRLLDAFDALLQLLSSTVTGMLARRTCRGASFTDASAVFEPQEPLRQEWLGRLFGSATMEGLCARAFQQCLAARYHIARNAFLLLCLLDSLAHEVLCLARVLRS
jgi:hypothetical protein